MLRDARIHMATGLYPCQLCGRCSWKLRKGGYNEVYDSRLWRITLEFEGHNFSVVTFAILCGYCANNVHRHPNTREVARWVRPVPKGVPCSRM